MIDLIDRIFQDAGLEKKGELDLNIYGYKNRKNYWIIIHCEDAELEKIIENQVDLFITAKATIQDPSFDKNANLLILYRAKSLTQLNVDLLLRIEENPYHLKKNVLYYTEEERINLNKVIEGSSPLNTLESMILDEKIFESHKNSFDKNNFESLVYRMAIKIPFIKINATQVNNLKSLEDLNNRSLEDSTLNELLLSDFFTLEDGEFTGMTNEEVFEKLKTILPNENQ
jgi:hypothetical protein